VGGGRGHVSSTGSTCSVWPSPTFCDLFRLWPLPFRYPWRPLGGGGGSDVVLEAHALPRGRKFWCLGLMPAALAFRWLASASEKLSRFGLDLTASVSPWLIWLMGKPHITQNDGYGSVKPNPHNLSICCRALTSRPKLNASASTTR